MPQIALQLYSIHDLCEHDFLGTIRRMADIGYDGVEFAGFFDTPADQLRQTLVDTDLSPIGVHLVVDAFRNDLDNQIAYAHAIGMPALIITGFWGVDYANPDTYKNFAAEFNHLGVKCNAANLRLLYHTHGYEFTRFADGRTGMDILVAETDPALVAFEPDLYWVEKAGNDVLAFYPTIAHRAPYLHLMDAQDRQTWGAAEVGAGIIDIAGVVRANFPVDWLVVEQHDFAVPPLESVAVSLRNVRGMLP